MQPQMQSVHGSQPITNYASPHTIMTDRIAELLLQVYSPNHLVTDNTTYPLNVILLTLTHLLKCIFTYNARTYH